MEHVTIKTMDGGYYKLTPDAGYVIRVKMSMRAYGEVVTKDLDMYEVVKDGEGPQPAPAPIIPTDPLERARQKKIADIEAYDKSDSVNSFTLGGQKMWLTVSERQQIDEQLEAHKKYGRTEMTRYFCGVPFTFTLEQWEQMLTKLLIYAGDALNVTESHKAAVMAMESVEDVEAFDITQGYPKKLVF